MLLLSLYFYAAWGLPLQAARRCYQIPPDEARRIPISWEEAGKTNSLLGWKMLEPEFWMLNVGKFPRGRMLRAGQVAKLTKVEPKKKPPLTVRQHPGADND